MEAPAHHYTGPPDRTPQLPSIYRPMRVCGILWIEAGVDGHPRRIIRPSSCCEDLPPGATEQMSSILKHLKLLIKSI